MPLIDLKSDLAARATRVLNENERRADDSSRLLKLLAGSTGLIFAAKQVLLDPKSATKRLAAITAQIGLNSVPFGLGNHIGFNPNNSILGNSIEGSAEEVTLFGDLQDVKAAKSKKDPEKVILDVRPTFSKDTGKKGDEAEGFEAYKNTPYDKTRSAKNREANSYEYGDIISVRNGIRKDKIDSSLYFEGDYAELADIDLVPFYFTALDPKEDGTVSPSYHLAFRSFFNNITDSTNGNYSSYNFVGRGENFYTYQSYSRSVSFGFKVAAFSEQQLGILHRKVEVLRKFAAPKYKGGYMQGNFINLTIGNLYKNMPGTVNSVSVTVSDNVPWEVINRSYIMPHVMDISITFTALEEQTPASSFATVKALEDSIQPQAQSQTESAEERRLQEADDFFRRSSTDPTLRF